MNETYTHSRLRAMRRCHRLHEYQYELMIRPQEDPKPLRMGSAFHTGIDLWRQGLDDATAIHQATADYETTPAWATTDELLDEWRLEAEIVRRMLSGYFWRWQDHLQVVASELVFEMPLVNPATGRPARDCVVAGKIDSIVMLDVRQAVLETKLISDDISPASDLWRRLRIDEQVSLEMLGARHMGYDVETIIYDLARKPTIRPRQISKADRQRIMVTGEYFGEPVADRTVLCETPAMFGARLTHDIGERPDHYFGRHEVTRLEDDLTDFRHDLWEQVKLIREARKRGRWARNSDSCLNYGKCPYFDPVCSMGERLDGSRVPSRFVRLTYPHPELERHDDTASVGQAEASATACSA